MTLQKEVSGFVKFAGELTGAEGYGWLLDISWSRDSLELTLLRELMKNFLLRPATSLMDESAVEARARPVVAKVSVVKAVEEEVAEVAWKP